METDRTVLVLSDKRWLRNRDSSTRILMLVLVLLAMLPLLAIAFIFRDAPWEQLSQKLIQLATTTDWPHALLRHLDKFAMLCVVLGQFYYMRQARELERLTLSSAGIRYTSPLPPVLKRLKPDWFISWNEIRKTEVGLLNVRTHDPQFALLTLHTASGKQRLFPARWVDPASHTFPRFRFSFSLKTEPRDAVIRSVMSSDVMQYISRNVPSLAIEHTPTAEIATSLEKNPHGRMAIVIIAALMIYAFIDTLAGPDSYADQPMSFVHIYVISGIVGALLAGTWLYRSTLAAAEIAGLAFLIGAVLAVAMIPGALRINAYTDQTGGLSYDYFVLQDRDGVVLRPVVEGMPIIDYFGYNRYWNEFGVNDTCLVRLRKGSLGFYQFDSAAIVDEIRRHEAR